MEFSSQKNHLNKLSRDGGDKAGTSGDQAQRSFRFRISCEYLIEGMFVAELDRPWLDTPFLIEGILVTDPQELATFKRICHYVYVDLDKSNKDVVSEIARAHRLTESHQSGNSHLMAVTKLRSSVEVSNNYSTAENAEDTKRKARLQTNRKIHAAFEKVRGDWDDVHNESDVKSKGRRRFQTRNDTKVTQETRGKFTGLVRSIADDVTYEETLADRAVQWVKDLFGGKASPDELAAQNKKVRHAIRQDLLQSKGLSADGRAKVRFVTYPDKVSAADETPRALKAFGSGEMVLGQLIQDIRNGKVPAVESVKIVVDEMVDSMIDNPDALLWIARLREDHVVTYNHGVKVGLYMVALGRHLGFPRKELSTLGLIGMLADVGKTRLPRALLDKPGMLSSNEYAIAKEHVKLGIEALKETGQLTPEVELGISQHHERMDGSGYPSGLKGHEISVYGRMAAIADCFAALITPRAYANPQPPQEALMTLYEWGEKSLHQPLVEQFVQAVSVFPVGSMVELTSGEICVVLAHNRVKRLEPKVLVLTWPDKTPLATPVERDLMANPRDFNNKPIRIARGLAAGAYGLKLRDYYGTELAAANSLL